MPGAARVGDRSQCPADAHGCPGCPHGVIGPAVTGSQDVLINGRPALRVGDPGIHAACCGPNQWTAVQGSPDVFINGKPAHRLGDADQHCGGLGRMIEGSPDVLINEGGGASAAPPVPVVATGLGPGVDALVAQSPTLASQVEALHRQGWSIQYGPAGGGSYADRTQRRIIIDQSESSDPNALTQTLAHEAGHALYTPPPEVPMEGRTRDQYVNENLQRHLRDEGEATMNNLRVREEILRTSGTDIGVAGSNASTYNTIYQRYRSREYDRNTAIEQISNHFGNEQTSTTRQTYTDYYGQPYADRWDRAHAAGGGR